MNCLTTLKCYHDIQIGGVLWNLTALKNLISLWKSITFLKKVVQKFLKRNDKRFCYHDKHQ